MAFSGPNEPTLTDVIVGFLILLSKLSDIYGRKPLILLTVFLFTVFSAGCGAAQGLRDL